MLSKGTRQLHHTNGELQPPLLSPWSPSQAPSDSTPTTGIMDVLVYGLHEKSYKNPQQAYVLLKYLPNACVPS